ncbi:MAG: hypothetical protein MUD00_01165 [Candidatus Pacebacteria bacterium]|jgi:hypothetical protein|nr:hypothetical protein [Candidatus Paceibacterota bacterium]
MKAASTTNSQIKSLVSTGRAMFDMPVTDMVEQAIPYFLQLTQEDEARRMQWLVDLSGDRHDPDDGLVEKNGEGTDDRKFFFHYRPHIEHIIHANGGNTVKYGKYISLLSEIYRQCEHTFQGIIGGIDEALPGYRLLEKYMKLKPGERGVLRLLFYKPGNRILAKAHTDRNFGTLHIHESYPGLYLDDDKECFKVERDKSLVFFGEKASIETDGALKPSIHYVEATTSEWRWSVVYFAHIECRLSQHEIEAIVKKKKTEFSYPNHGNETHCPR